MRHPLAQADHGNVFPAQIPALARPSENPPREPFRGTLRHNFAIQEAIAAATEMRGHFSTWRNIMHLKLVAAASLAALLGFGTSAFAQMDQPAEPSQPAQGTTDTASAPAEPDSATDDSAASGDRQQPSQDDQTQSGDGQQQPDQNGTSGSEPH
jgi:hypothetical protein